MHDAEDSAGETAAVPRALGVGACGVLGLEVLEVLAADGWVAGVPVAPEAVEGAAVPETGPVACAGAVP